MTFFTLRVEVATGPSVKGAGTAQHWFRGGQLWKPAVGRECRLTDTGRVGAVLGAAQTSGARPPLQTLPGLREKGRGGAGPAVGCGGPGGRHPSLSSPTQASFCGGRATDAAPRAPVTS